MEFSSIMGVALSINDTGFKVDISSVFLFDTSIKPGSWERIQFKEKELCEKKHLICKTFPFVLIHILLFLGSIFSTGHKLDKGLRAGCPHQIYFSCTFISCYCPNSPQTTVDKVWV